MKIILNNFQILEGENVLEFNEGINVVVGPNASGKSSMFYAVENALTNPNGVDDCINYNHNQTSVTIENNNNSITWIRKPGSCEYVNNLTGDRYVKASKLDSRSLGDLGFYFDLKNRVVNIHNEWSVLFPFGESDADMFRLFEDIFNISCSFQVLDEMKKDEQNLKSNLSKSQIEKSSLVNRLQTLNEMKDAVSVDDLNYYLQTIQSCSQRASELEEDYKMFSKYYLYKNIVLPPVYDVSNLYQAFHNLQTVQNDYNTLIGLQSKASIQLPDIKTDYIIPEFDNQLKVDYEQYCVCKADLADLQRQLVEFDKRKQELEQEISKIRVCPTCGSILEDK